MNEITKTLYLVCGPESAGNRLMARILIEAGCYGDGDVIQKLDKKDPPSDVDKIVLHRSFPYGHRNENRHWPTICDIWRRFLVLGYDNMIMIIMVRDKYCLAKSQVKAQHVSSEEEAKRNIDRAYRVIFMQAAFEYIPVPYESLILHPKETISWILKDLGLPQIEFSEEIRDENFKWYQETME